MLISQIDGVKGLCRPTTGAVLACLLNVINLIHVPMSFGSVPDSWVARSLWLLGASLDSSLLPEVFRQLGLASDSPGQCCYSSSHLLQLFFYQGCTQQHGASSILGLVSAVRASAMQSVSRCMTPSPAWVAVLLWS